jgi:acyl transferase domain-containing protein
VGALGLDELIQLIKFAYNFAFNFNLRHYGADCACSSSLVATHIGACGIAPGETGAAFACGVHAIMHPTGMRLFFAGGMLSPEGRCKTLDTAADGYVRGEARGVVGSGT